MTQAPSGVQSSRPIIVVSAGLFVVSGLFPTAASLLEADRVPMWLGVCDVVVAAALVVLGMVIVSRKPSEFAAPVVATSFRAYRGLASSFLILLVLFFVAGDNIRWSILLPGLAWRGWLLTIALPSWLSAWQTEQRSVVG
jgi:hypothetical protein